MMNGLLDRLRGARRVELFAALMLLALLALLFLGRSAPGGGDGTALEARLARVLSEIDGAGKVSVMVSEGADGRAEGALVVAKGLTDVQTYLSLQGAVSTLLGLEPDKIEIIGADGRFGG